TRFSRDWSSDVCSSDLGMTSGASDLLVPPSVRFCFRLEGRSQTLSPLSRRGASGYQRQSGLPREDQKDRHRSKEEAREDQRQQRREAAQAGEQQDEAGDLAQSEGGQSDHPGEEEDALRDRCQRRKPEPERHGIPHQRQGKGRNQQDERKKKNGPAMRSGRV